ncbi:MAG: ATP-binding cassette domain-containing protein, partial [Muribaculaceae bacterium]|nr:ATP-binding cassette domain-containing protein [Muribaculaceae bacterium]
MKPLLRLDSDTLYYSTRELANPGHVVVPRGITVVIGPNGSGKSMLADIIERGRNFRTNRITFEGIDRPIVRKVEFADVHSLRGITATGYYQQRYEATMNDEVPTVAEALGTAFDLESVKSNCELLDLHDVMEKRINYLSSGELRKLLISTALTSRPDLLILDNPYIGLDVDSRRVLDNALQR